LYGVGHWTPIQVVNIVIWFNFSDFFEHYSALTVSSKTVFGQLEYKNCAARPLERRETVSAALM
jgi:hypothetical protein